MALRDMKSDLAIGVGSKQTPQSFQDGHSATTVTGQKSFGEPPRIIPAPSSLSALSRQSEQLNFKFNDTFNTTSIVTSTKDTLDKYYERAFSQTDPLGARNNNRFGFDEPFILKAIGDRWGPGGAGVIDFGLVRAGAVTQAARTVADVIRLGKFAVTPKGVAFALKQDILQKLNAGGQFSLGTIGDIINNKLGNPLPTNLPTMQRVSTGRDSFGSTPPTSDFLLGSDIRTWRPSSIIDSLPIGAHYVRHQIPAGSPSILLLKNASKLVSDIGDGTIQFAGGIREAFPGIVDATKSSVTALGEGLANIIRDNVKAPKFVFGDNSSLTSFFPSLISIPAIQTPNFSALTNMLGGLASEAASLAASVASKASSALGGISLPNISLPKLPNMKIPEFPNVNIPNIGANVFTGISQVAKFVIPSVPKFAGTGGLGIGANFGGNPFRELSELKSMVSNPSFHYDLKQNDDNSQSGALTNIYNKDFKYNNAKEFGKGVRFGLGSEIELEDENTFDSTFLPTALSAGFLFGAKYGETKTVKKTPINANIVPKSIDGTIPNAVSQPKDKRGARLDSYKLSSYGQLNQEEGYGYKKQGENADVKRGIGSPGDASRIVLDDEGNVIKVSGATGYSNNLVDKVNLHPYGGTSAGDILNDNNDDFVPLKFRDMVNGKWIIFRTILESVTDTSSPEYAEERYIGRPDKVYVYQGATRNVNITFKVFPKSVQEMVTLWEKLNYLRGLVYPKIENNRMVSPFFSFTLGDMFDKQPMIFQSLNYTIDTQSTWEIKPGLRLPKLVNVSADMRVIDKQVPQTTGKHYNLGWLEENLPYGTFKNDPSGPASIVPDRKGYNALYGELGIRGADDESLKKLTEGKAAIDAAVALRDSLKSDVNESAKDFPKQFAADFGFNS